MKQLQFLILTYIDTTVKETYIITTTLIDIGFEVIFFQDFLLLKWEKLLSDRIIKIKGVHPITTSIHLVQGNVSIILGSKILNIPLVLQYNLGYDILLGNDTLNILLNLQKLPILYISLQNVDTH